MANLENKEVKPRILRKEFSNCVRTMPNVIGIRVYIDHELVCVVLMSLRHLPLRSLKPVGLSAIK